MRGNVYRVGVDHAGLDTHPHVLTIFSGKEALVVPAFTAGKPAVTQALEALRAQGYREDQVCVTLDNSLYLYNCVRGYQPHIACWFTYRCYWDQKKKYEGLTPTCIMNDDGLKLIARALRELTTLRPSIVAATHAASLDKIINCC